MFSVCSNLNEKSKEKLQGSLAYVVDLKKLLELEAAKYPLLSEIEESLKKKHTLKTDIVHCWKLAAFNSM